jgi:hypothetical protein
MKTLSCGSIFFILCKLFVSSTAHAAQWMDMHGTNCKVEIPGNTTGVFYYGWGVDFTQKAFTGNWVHCPIPVTGAEQVSKIYVQYYKSSTAGKINVIHLYNGLNFVKAITPPVGVVGPNSFQIDLGSFMSFGTGLGVTLNITSGDGSTRFQIGDVAAWYQ